MKMIKPLLTVLTLTIAVNLAFADQPSPADSKKSRTADATCGPGECAPATHKSSCQCSTSQPAVATNAAKPAKSKSIRVNRSANPTHSPNTRTLKVRPMPAPRATSIVWESDIRRAAIRSTRDGKPMLLNVSADWCHFCRQMKSETYTQRAVIDQINHSFVAVDLDADTKRELVQLLGIKSLPTILLVTPDIKVVATMNGFQSADALMTQLNQVAPGRSRRTEKTDDTVKTVSHARIVE